MRTGTKLLIAGIVVLAIAGVGASPAAAGCGHTGGGGCWTPDSVAEVDLVVEDSVGWHAAVPTADSLGVVVGHS